MSDPCVLPAQVAAAASGAKSMSTTPKATSASSPKSGAPFEPLLLTAYLTNLPPCQPTTPRPVVIQSPSYPPLPFEGLQAKPLNAKATSAEPANPKSQTAWTSQANSSKVPNPWGAAAQPMGTNTSLKALSPWGGQTVKVSNSASKTATPSPGQSPGAPEGSNGKGNSQTITVPTTSITTHVSSPNLSSPNPFINPASPNASSPPNPTSPSAPQTQFTFAAVAKPKPAAFNPKFPIPPVHISSPPTIITSTASTQSTTSPVHPTVVTTHTTSVPGSSPTEPIPMPSYPTQPALRGIPIWPSMQSAVANTLKDPALRATDTTRRRLSDLSGTQKSATNQASAANGQGAESSGASQAGGKTAKSSANRKKAKTGKGEQHSDMSDQSKSGKKVSGHAATTKPVSAASSMETDMLPPQAFMAPAPEGASANLPKPAPHTQEPVRLDPSSDALHVTTQGHRQEGSRVEVWHSASNPTSQDAGGPNSGDDGQNGQLPSGKATTSSSQGVTAPSPVATLVPTPSSRFAQFNPSMSQVITSGEPLTEVKLTGGEEDEDMVMLPGGVIPIMEVRKGIQVSGSGKVRRTPAGDSEPGAAGAGNKQGYASVFTARNPAPSRQSSFKKTISTPSPRSTPAVSAGELQSAPSMPVLSQLDASQLSPPLHTSPTLSRTVTTPVITTGFTDRPMRGGRIISPFALWGNGVEAPANGGNYKGGMAQMKQVPSGKLDDSTALEQQVHGSTTLTSNRPPHSDENCLRDAFTPADKTDQCSAGENAAKNVTAAEVPGNAACNGGQDGDVKGSGGANGVSDGRVSGAADDAANKQEGMAPSGNSKKEQTFVIPADQLKHLFAGRYDRQARSNVPLDSLEKAREPQPSNGNVSPFSYTAQPHTAVSQQQQSVADMESLLATSRSQQLTTTGAGEHPGIGHLKPRTSPVTSPKLEMLKPGSPRVRLTDWTGKGKNEGDEAEDSDGNNDSLSVPADQLPPAAHGRLRKVQMPGLVPEAGSGKLESGKLEQGQDGQVYQQRMAAEKRSALLEPAAAAERASIQAMLQDAFKQEAAVRPPGGFVVTTGRSLPVSGGAMPTPGPAGRWVLVNTGTAGAGTTGTLRDQPGARSPSGDAAKLESAGVQLLLVDGARPSSGTIPVVFSHTAGGQQERGASAAGAWQGAPRLMPVPAGMPNFPAGSQSGLPPGVCLMPFPIPTGRADRMPPKDKKTAASMLPNAAAASSMPMAGMPMLVRSHSGQYSLQPGGLHLETTQLTAEGARAPIQPNGHWSLPAPLADRLKQIAASAADKEDGGEGRVEAKRRRTKGPNHPAPCMVPVVRAKRTVSAASLHALSPSVTADTAEIDSPPVVDNAVQSTDPVLRRRPMHVHVASRLHEASEQPPSSSFQFTALGASGSLPTPDMSKAADRARGFRVTELERDSQAEEQERDLQFKEEERQSQGEQRGRQLQGGERERQLLQGEEREQQLQGEERDSQLPGEERDKDSHGEQRERQLQGEQRERQLQGEQRERQLQGEDDAAEKSVDGEESDAPSLMQTEDTELVEDGHRHRHTSGPLADKNGQRAAGRTNHHGPSANTSTLSGKRDSARQHHAHKQAKRTAGRAAVRYEDEEVAAALLGLDAEAIGAGSRHPTKEDTAYDAADGHDGHDDGARDDGGRYDGGRDASGRKDGGRYDGVQLKRSPHAHAGKSRAAAAEGRLDGRAKANQRKAAKAKAPAVAPKAQDSISEHVISHNTDCDVQQTSLSLATANGAPYGQGSVAQSGKESGFEREVGKGSRAQAAGEEVSSHVVEEYGIQSAVLALLQLQHSTPPAPHDKHSMRRSARVPKRKAQPDFVGLELLHQQNAAQALVDADTSARLKSAKHDHEDDDAAEVAAATLGIAAANSQIPHASSHENIPGLASCTPSATQSIASEHIARRKAAESARPASSSCSFELSSPISYPKAVRAPASVVEFQHRFFDQYSKSMSSRPGARHSKPGRLANTKEDGPGWQSSEPAPSHNRSHQSPAPPDVDLDSITVRVPRQTRTSINRRQRQCLQVPFTSPDKPPVKPSRSKQPKGSTPADKRDREAPKGPITGNKNRDSEQDWQAGAGSHRPWAMEDISDSQLSAQHTPAMVHDARQPPRSRTKRVRIPPAAGPIRGRHPPEDEQEQGWSDPEEEPYHKPGGRDHKPGGRAGASGLTGDDTHGEQHLRSVGLKKQGRHHLSHNTSKSRMRLSSRTGPTDDQYYDAGHGASDSEGATPSGSRYTQEDRGVIEYDEDEKPRLKRARSHLIEPKVKCGKAKGLDPASDPTPLRPAVTRKTDDQEAGKNHVSALLPRPPSFARSQSDPNLADAAPATVPQVTPSIPTFSFPEGRVRRSKIMFKSRSGSDPSDSRHPSPVRPTTSHNGPQPVGPGMLPSLPEAPRSNPRTGSRLFKRGAKSAPEADEGYEGASQPNTPPEHSRINSQQMSDGTPPQGTDHDLPSTHEGPYPPGTGVATQGRTPLSQHIGSSIPSWPPSSTLNHLPLPFLSASQGLPAGGALSSVPVVGSTSSGATISIPGTSTPLMNIPVPPTHNSAPAKMMYTPQFSTPGPLTSTPVSGSTCSTFIDRPLSLKASFPFPTLTPPTTSGPPPAPASSQPRTVSSMLPQIHSG